MNNVLFKSQFVFPSGASLKLRIKERSICLFCRNVWDGAAHNIYIDSDRVDAKLE